jgi:H+/Cl- antiporter ClcA
MDNNDITEINSEENKIDTANAALPTRILGAVVVLSLIFGIFGGITGALYFAKMPAFQKFFASPSSPSISQRIVRMD